MVETTTTKSYWSKDPEEEPLYSDWRITFLKKCHANFDDCGGDSESGGGSSSSNMSTVTYHVHRNMIGPRSEYFTRLFCQPLSDGNANQQGI